MQEAYPAEQCSSGINRKEGEKKTKQKNERKGSAGFSLSFTKGRRSADDVLRTQQRYISLLSPIAAITGAERNEKNGAEKKRGPLSDNNKVLIKQPAKRRRG